MSLLCSLLVVICICGCPISLNASWHLDSFPDADLLCLLNNLSWRFFHIGTYWCTASLLYLFNVCGCMVSHSCVFSSVPHWWTGAECINLETQSLHIHTYRPLEFIGFLCRVKEEKNEVEVCACTFIHTCRIRVPVWEFSSDGISLCTICFCMVMYIAGTMRKLHWWRWWRSCSS